MTNTENHFIVEPETLAPTFEVGVRGMDCASCAQMLERSLAQLEGLEHVEVNFATARLRATGRVDRDAIARRVRALGYDLDDEPAAPGAEQVEPVRAGGAGGFLGYLLSERDTVLALVAAGLLAIAALINWLLPAAPGLLVLGLELAAIVIAGTPIAIRGIRSLIYARQVTINLLMTIAAVGAAIIGEMGEAATVVMLFAIGEALEGYSTERARDSLRSLLQLAPDEATVLRACIDCDEHLGQGGYEGGPCPFCGTHEVTVPVAEVAVGEVALVRPGERIPVDGVVQSGASAVNQAPITGESVPVAKAAGDTVFAGSINGAGALEVVTTRAATDSTLNRIIRLVEQAQSQRSPAERFIDRFAQWYTPAVVVLAVLVAAVPPLVFGAPFVNPANPSDGWLYRALALLIIACPCALVISTPVTVVSSLTALARRGVLVKGGAFLEAMSGVKVVAFDKTGTLTEGKPVVTRTRTALCPPDAETCEACDDLLAVAASVERRSEHPLARAVIEAAEARALAGRYAAAQDVQTLAGRGVRGMLNGSRVTVGSHALFHEEEIGCNGLHEQIEAAEAAGETVILVGKDGEVQGFIAVADQPRVDTQAALSVLKEINPSLRLVMLTGDNPAVARAIADKIGSIDEVRAGLLPEDKVEAVQALQAQYGPVAMIGDGVNDAPALARATVGVAMGGTGTDQAMETADVVLMQDNLVHLPDLAETSLRTQRIIKQNVAFSLLIKLVFLLLALPGLATLWMAVFADMGASLLVTGNGMRMLRGGRYAVDNAGPVS